MGSAGCISRAVHGVVTLGKTLYANVHCLDPGVISGRTEKGNALKFNQFCAPKLVVTVEAVHGLRELRWLTHTHTYPPTHPHTYTHTHVYIYTHTHLHTHTYTHTHTHTHTHIYIYIYNSCISNAPDILPDGNSKVHELKKQKV